MGNRKLTIGLRGVTGGGIGGVVGGFVGSRWGVVDGFVGGRHGICWMPQLTVYL